MQNSIRILNVIGNFNGNFNVIFDEKLKIDRNRNLVKTSIINFKDFSKLSKPIHTGI